MPLKKAPGAYHHGALRASLIRATAAIVRRRGADAVTMRAVATRAGVSAPAAYHHFHDKRELLAAAAADGFHALGAALVDAADLPALAEAWMRFALTEPGRYRLIVGAHVEELDLASIPETRAAGVAARELVLGQIRAALPGVDTHHAFRLLWAQLHGTASLFVEKELGAGFTEADAIALARDGVARLVASFSRTCR